MKFIHLFRCNIPFGASKQMLRVMRIFIVLMTVFLIQVSAATKAQQITIKGNNLSLREVIKQIRKQTGYTVLAKSNIVNGVQNLKLDLKEVGLEDALRQILKPRHLDFSISEKAIFIKEVEKSFIDKVMERFQEIDVKGKVLDENGQPLSGATIKVKGGKQVTVSNAEGDFTFRNLTDDAVLLVAYIGYESREVKASEILSITLVKSTSKLDEVQVIAYGTTTKRLNTGSVGTITAKDIERQPVSNPLATLIGRVPGLVVTQQSGVPGSSFTVQIRGRNSIAQGSQPLILIDGIPFAAGNENIQLIGSAISNANQQSGVSPFAAINPADIESMEILKDADATAIYGSRGANGVILITTKKGKAGKTQVTANFNQGITQAGKLLPLLNTEQYIAMRNEAFANAGTTPTALNAPDLKIYDQTRYTDYQKEFLGGTGHTTNANLSLSGGSETTQFLLSGTYYRETNIFPGNLPNQRGSMLANINHKSIDNRFSVNFSGNFTSVENSAATADLAFYTYLSPNTPTFFNEDGKLQWAYNGVSIENPYAYLKEKYQIRTNNLSSSLNANYRLWDGLTAKILMGYNQQFTNEQKLSPADAKNPNTTTIQGHSAIFGKNQFSSWNIEPQLEYKSKLWIGSLTALVGTTFLSRTNNSLTVEASGYSSEALLESLDAATTIDASSMNSKYRYQALFGRLNYNIADKYLMNLTGRRDGSSRFGPGKQFANFGAFGAAWIFSSEKWFEKNLSVVSFGKLRGSYGVTGNDQIGDYQFVETWKSPSYTYFGDASLIPNNLFNADYAWERNKKLEGAIDLGFLKDRILFSAGYYQNRSSNQLINYRLPYLTGFSNVIANFPATVENKGWELSITATPVQKKQFSWNSSFNITIPKNTLLSFPGIESSSYQSLYVVGHSLNTIYNYKSLGVNSATGQLDFYDANGNNAVDIGDYQINGTTDPKFYGGWQNTLSYKGLELQWFFDFKKQMGKNINYYLYGGFLPAGSMKNQPELLADRWKNPGDVSELPKMMPSGIGVVASNTANSSFSYSNQSFIRLRNVSLSYNFNLKALAKIGARSARMYVQGQNLLTFNRTKGYDPETQSPTSTPILQAYAVGLQISY